MGFGLRRSDVLNFFMAGADRVRWEVTATGGDGCGPFRLVVSHPAGTITEYFDDVTQALLRQRKLEERLTSAPTSAVADVGSGPLAGCGETFSRR
jgi:hypothetical protein